MSVDAAFSPITATRPPTPRCTFIKALAVRATASPTSAHVQVPEGSTMAMSSGCSIARVNIGAVSAETKPTLDTRDRPLVHLHLEQARWVIHSCTLFGTTS